MPDFDLIASTTRGGIAIDEIEFEVPDAPPATGYLLGHHQAGQVQDKPQPLVIASHDERGDKASLLPDLEHLSARGFRCLSIDSPVTRRAAADRDPLMAFTSQFSIVLSALNVLQRDPATDNPRSQPQKVALLGRGLGGEVSASVAAFTREPQVVVALGALPDRSEFVQRSTHPLAAGMRLFHGDAGVARQVAGLQSHRLVDQLEAADATNWLLQVADDDDRYSDEDHATMSLSIPRTVRVDHVAHTSDLTSPRARRNRVDFISNFCA